jgi:UDP-N-acetylmuramoyl-L-alanyl-D-glutamate--2,6-diaminopimelate ligase
MNALQAVLAAQAVRPINSIELAAAMPLLRAVPGRLERVGAAWPAPPAPDSATSQPVVLVDYAHTHDALDNVGAALRPLTRGRLITVFGCGGDRDATKRPKMAASACAFSDLVLLTSDNPRTEDPQAILDQVAAGVPAAALGKVQRIADRAIAIQTAIAQANPGDTVLIAGKGHEDYQIIGTVKHPFDDRRVAAAALASRS